MEDEGNPTLDPSPPQKLHRVPSLVLPEEAIFGTSTAAPCLECRDYHERHHKVTLQSPSQAGQVKSDGEVRSLGEQASRARGGEPGNGGDSEGRKAGGRWGHASAGGGVKGKGPRLPSPTNIFARKHFSFLTGTGREGEADKTPRTEESGSEEAPKLLLSQSLLAPSPPPQQITKPHRIILVRHGESTGNVDERVYVETPDWKVPLSPIGHEQARQTGRQLKALVGDEPLYIYTSPYRRTKQTLSNILESFEDNLKVGVREEPRITEQQFGNFQCQQLMQQAKKERCNFGRFYFRFPNGESGLDVYTRVTSFISTMFRDFADGHICRPDLNIVIVTHGLTLRLLLMRWFKLTVETFESTTNPPNGSFVVMTRKEGPRGGRSGGGVYEMAPESAALISLSCDSVPVGASIMTPCSNFEDNTGREQKNGGEERVMTPLSNAVERLSIDANGISEAEARPS